MASPGRDEIIDDRALDTVQAKFPSERLPLDLEEPSDFVGGRGWQRADFGKFGSLGDPQRIGLSPDGLAERLVAWAYPPRSFHVAFMNRSCIFGSEARTMKLAFRG